MVTTLMLLCLVALGFFGALYVIVRFIGGARLEIDPESYDAFGKGPWRE